MKPPSAGESSRNFTRSGRNHAEAAAGCRSPRRFALEWFGSVQRLPIVIGDLEIAAPWVEDIGIDARIRGGKVDAMIARLRGTIIEAYPNRLVVDVHGVGYEVFIPLSTFDRLHAGEGLSVDLRTHLHFSQLGQKLFGFASEEERDVFLLLIDRVSGVGPTMAVSVLSGMDVTDFKKAVVAGDVAALSRLKGVGKKTAERIVLELKDKVGVTETWQDAAAGQVSASAADAELALIALGYRQVDARKAVRKVLDADAKSPTEALVRGALRALQAN